jgi:hypothetical protein
VFSMRQKSSSSRVWHITVTVSILMLWSAGFSSRRIEFNPLNDQLNHICHFLTLLGAHHILHVSRIRFKYQQLKLGPIGCPKMSERIYHSTVVISRKMWVHCTAIKHRGVRVRNPSLRWIHWMWVHSVLQGYS